MEFLDRRCINAVEDHAGLGLDRDAGALLLFGDDGEPDLVERNLVGIERLCRESGATGTTVAPDIAAADALLEARRCSLPALARLAPITILEDVSVPRPCLAELVSRIEAIADRYRVTIATFGHAGDGNLHPTACVDPADGDAVDRAHAAFGEVFHTATALGGTITGEHGVGAAKLSYLAGHLGTAQMALLSRVKQAFDPAGVLNPGKLGSS
jgi:glycolate oxidase